MACGSELTAPSFYYFAGILKDKASAGNVRRLVCLFLLWAHGRASGTNAGYSD